MPALRICTALLAAEAADKAGTGTLTPCFRQKDIRKAGNAAGKGLEENPKKPDHTRGRTGTEERAAFPEYRKGTAQNRKNIMKRLITILICLALLYSLAAPAFAINQSRTVIGADLTAEQVAQVYANFGMRRGDVIELPLTNSEERRYLEGFVDTRVIGTRSISCVYVELLPQGSGMSVTTSNISWCTGDMYKNALATAGIADARIMVTAPFEVSGTAALAGVYKAYEDMTGVRLDDTAKMAGTQELTITGELAQQIGSMDSTSIVRELKQVLAQTGSMSDEEIRSVIRDISGQYGVELSDSQVSQLISLCRSLENLNPQQLQERVEQLQGTLQKLADAKTKVTGFAQQIRDFIESASGFMDTISNLLSVFDKEK